MHSEKTLSEKRSVSGDMLSSLVAGDSSDAEKLPSSFRLIRRLGTGSTGSVFLVEKDGKKFALKLFRTDGAKEAEILLKVQGDNVVRLAEKKLFSDEGRNYLLMEVAEGRTLEEIISEGQLCVKDKLLILKQTASALAGVHAKKILHLDVKPSNVVVDENLCVTLGDFSIARDLESSDDVAGKIAGTPAYMAPEAFEENGRLDTRTDVFSLGVLAYELFTGVKPFHGETVEEMLDEVRRKDPVRPRKLVCKLPPCIEWMLEKMLAKNPDDRYDDADEIVKDVDGILKDGKMISKRKTSFVRKIFPFIQPWS